MEQHNDIGTQKLIEVAEEFIKLVESYCLQQ